MKKKLLMIPGPVTLSNQILKILSLPIQPHYGEEWKRIYLKLIKKIKKVFNTNNKIIIFSGTGSLAIEAAIASSLKPKDEILICYNGYWSERIYEMSKSWNLKIIFLRENFDKPIDPNKLEEILKKKNKIKLITVVHVETSTGIENPIEEICKIAKKYQKLILVDSVAGLGATNIQIDKWKIDFLATSSQKCLSGPAGLGFLIISQNGIKAINNGKHKGWALNLKNIMNFQKKWKDWHPHGPQTAPVSLYMAISKSIDDIIKEKLSNRIIRHNKIKNYFRSELKKNHLELFVKEDKNASSTLTTFLLPKKINLNKFLEHINKKFDIILSGDLGFVNPNLVRVGHMGVSATLFNAKKVTYAIKKTIKHFLLK
jgi:aspartate aminotransferase-like enzyme